MDKAAPFSPEAGEAIDLTGGVQTGGSFTNLLGDVPLELSVELGRTRLSLREVAGRLGPGSIITLSKLTSEKLDVRVNDRLVARGEAVAVGDRFGIRITEIIRPDGSAT
jgi:flagellar motor switch protein FliN/FliY